MQLADEIAGLLQQLFRDLQSAVEPDVVQYLAEGLSADDDPDADELRHAGELAPLCLSPRGRPRHSRPPLPPLVVSVLVPYTCSDSMAGFCDSFGRLPPAKQQQLTADLLARVAAAKQQGRQPQAAAAAKPAVSIAAVAAEALSRISSLSVGSASGASSECGDGSEDEGAGTPAAWSAERAAAVAGLRELCALPGASDAFLAHVLDSKGGGDVEVGW